MEPIWKLGGGLLLVSLTVTLGTRTVLGGTVVLGPSDAWCNTINRASPGDEIVLKPGSYTDPCWMTARGAAGNPIKVHSQSLEPSQRAVFAYAGSTSNVIELHDAVYLELSGLSFAPTQEDVDAITIWRANDIVIEQNIFEGIGGISISANTYDSARITVRQNTFQNLKATCLYFGCQNGTDCHATAITIEGNLIDDVTPTDQTAIGYGLEIKLNSYGTVRDNTVYRTKGPGLMVYGSNRGDPASVIEGNYVESSQTDGGIVIGGGPAIVRNNVVVGNAYGGISAQNYAGRDLQQNVWIVHNTILNNGDSGINVEGWSAGAGNTIAFNAITPRSGTPSIRPSSPAGTISGNVTCTTSSSCFVNATTAPYNLWPTTNGPLLGAAGSGTEPWRPKDDFMGVLRDNAADVGAFERTSLTIDHLVGGGGPRPPRISSDTMPPSPPIGLVVR